MAIPGTSISVPAGFAPAVAVGFADGDGQLALASSAAPLPVVTSAPAPAPLAGESLESEIVGPFAATPGRVVVVALDGDWTGIVRLLRSTDGGATHMPLRVGGSPWAEYTSSGCEQAWSETEDGASFYLDIALQSGAVSYRVSQ